MMNMTIADKVRAAVILFLAVAIVTGGILIWQRYRPPELIEITLPVPPEWQGTVHIEGGNVTAGFYQFSDEDTITSLLRTAGANAFSANTSGEELYLKIAAGEPAGAQRIDINRADIWLLEALPGIGKTLAERIIVYRETNGRFRNTEDLLKVPGLGAATYANIQDLVTVSDR